jgi:uncharacterized protein CbrC (UPF0167 family)
MDMTKNTPFRQWLRKKWFEHCDEIEAFTGKPCEYHLQDYFLKYKWWLKTIYQREKQHD